MNIINSSYLPNQNQYSINTDTVRYNDKTANNVPNGLLRVPEAQPNKNITNNILSDSLRKIYNPRLISVKDGQKIYDQSGKDCYCLDTILFS